MLSANGKDPRVPVEVLEGLLHLCQCHIVLKNLHDHPEHQWLVPLAPEVAAHQGTGRPATLQQETLACDLYEVTTGETWTNLTESAANQEIRSQWLTNAHRFTQRRDARYLTP